VLKSKGIIFQSGWICPAKSHSGASPSPAKTKTWQGPSLSFCGIMYQEHQVFSPHFSQKSYKSGMSKTHVISALVTKRAMLTGQMLDLDRRKAALRVQVHHIDHSLAIFGYKDAPRAIRPVAPKVYRFDRRELGRLLARFTVGTNREIALAIIVHKEWDIGDRVLVGKVADSVKSAKKYKARVARQSVRG
jgi:hypothetical protein